ncbi:MAG: hypothetical protein DI636_05605 [Pelagerythrobacter marensis]|nr:MAG: hypothetical protein DI636_05605 [Pelagerythrobacter marensis]
MTCRLALFALALALPLAALAPPALAAPGDMSVATFLEKANGLKRRGPLALVHADYRLLRSEAQAGARLYRGRLAADRAAGRAPHSCPPPREQIGQNEFLGHFESYPAAQRPRVHRHAGLCRPDAPPLSLPVTGSFVPKVPAPCPEGA